MPHPLIPWPGGKRRLSRTLLALFPEHTTYVEPFAGAAAMLFAKPESSAEVINDLNGELINLYRVVQHHLDELVRQFRWSLVSRKMFDWAKIARPETLTDIQRAARFYYLQKTAFGGKVEGQTFGVAVTSPPRLNLLRMEEDLSQAHLRLSRVTVEHLPWADCVTRYDRPGTLFFMDPPYWETEGYGVPFPLVEYKRLARALRTMKGRAILTINDHPEMRRIFAKFPCQEATLTYTIGLAKDRGRSTELIYRNWP